MHFRGSFAASGLIVLLAGLLASAGLIEVYSATDKTTADTNYEGLGGFLQTTYGLSTITTPGNITQNTVLPQLERAVGQLKNGTGATGLYVPSSASGTPGVSYPITGGGTGNGVWDALTNHNHNLNVGGSSSNLTGGALPALGSAAGSIDFSFSRTGNVVTYATSIPGSNPAKGTTWVSSTQTYFSDINAVEFRIRSTAGNTESYTNLKYNGSALDNVISAPNGVITAKEGEVTIELISGLSGDFNVTGTFNTTGGGWNTQIKALDLPASVSSVPEPSTLFSAVVGGIGCLIAAARRRKST